MYYYYYYYFRVCVCVLISKSFVVRYKNHNNNNNNRRRRRRRRRRNREGYENAWRVVLYRKVIRLWKEKSSSGGRDGGSGGGFLAEDLALRVTNTRFPTSCRRTTGSPVDHIFYVYVFTPPPSSTMTFTVRRRSVLRKSFFFILVFSSTQYLSYPYCRRRCRVGGETAGVWYDKCAPSYNTRTIFYT